MMDEVDLRPGLPGRCCGSPSGRRSELWRPDGGHSPPKVDDRRANPSLREVVTGRRRGRARFAALPPAPPVTGEADYYAPPCAARSPLSAPCRRPARRLRRRDRGPRGRAAAHRGPCSSTSAARAATRSTPPTPTARSRRASSRAASGPTGRTSTCARRAATTSCSRSATAASPARSCPRTSWWARTPSPWRTSSPSTRARGGQPAGEGPRRARPQADPRGPRAARAALARRGFDPAVLDEALELDERRRALLPELEELRRRKNEASKRIGELQRAGEDASEAIAEVRGASAREKELDEELRVGGGAPRRGAGRAAEPARPERAARGRGAARGGRAGRARAATTSELLGEHSTWRRARAWRARASST